MEGIAGVREYCGGRANCLAGYSTESNELDFRQRLSGVVAKPAYAAAWRKRGGGER